LKETNILAEIFYGMIRLHHLLLGGNMKTVSPDFERELLEITKLSKKINKNDTLAIIQMMKDHVFEIEELYNDTNEHWTIETADLLVLCYELLMMENKDIDDVFARCLPRFDKKLNWLVKNGK
jgi:hypothetical protein